MLDLLANATPSPSPTAAAGGGFDLFGIILWPLKWVVELILVAWHWLFTAIGLPPAEGITWVLAIVGLVVVVRAALIPLFVKQIKSQRKMMEIAPELRKIQDKYRGKKDQLSREAMSRETMALYKKHGTSPVSGCLPLLVQMPVFFSLYSVLSSVKVNAELGLGGGGMLSTELTKEFYDASLFGVASLHETLIDAWNTGNTPAVMSLAVLHAAPDHLQEPLPRGQDRPGLPDAAHHAVGPAVRVRLLGCLLPAGCRALLVHQQHLDDGSAVHRHP